MTRRQRILHNVTKYNEQQLFDLYRKGIASHREQDIQRLEGVLRKLNRRCGRKLTQEVVNQLGLAFGPPQQRNYGKMNFINGLKRWAETFIK